MLDRLDRWLARAHRGMVFAGCALLILLMLAMNADLLLRSAFRSPIEGISEMGEIALLYITFLGTAWVYREDGHVVVDLLVYEMYAKAEKPLKAINNAIVGLIAAVLVYYGSLLTYDHFARGVRNVSVLETPMALIVVAIPLGSLALLLEVVLKFRKIAGNA